VLCGCESWYEVFAEHVAGSGEHEDNRVGVAARQSKVLPVCAPRSWALLT